MLEEKIENRNKLLSDLAGSKWKQMVLKYKKEQACINLKREIIKFIREQTNYSIKLDYCLYFITLRYSRFNKPDNYESARKYLRDILKQVYVELYGKRRWIKHLPKSITIIEKGKKNHLHSHTIVNIPDCDLVKINKIFESVTVKNPELSIDYKIWLVEDKTDSPNQCYVPNKNDIVIEPIYPGLKDINRVIKYILKEYNFKNSKLDFSNFFNEKLLFRVLR